MNGDNENGGTKENIFSASNTLGRKELKHLLHERTRSFDPGMGALHRFETGTSTLYDAEFTGVTFSQVPLLSPSCFEALRAKLFGLGQRGQLSRNLYGRVPLGDQSSKTPHHIPSSGYFLRKIVKLADQQSRPTTHRSHFTRSS